MIMDFLNVRLADASLLELTILGLLLWGIWIFTDYVFNLIKIGDIK